MTPAELEHADDCAYQICALLRVLEVKARDIVNTMAPGPQMQPINDIATLCELAGFLAETIHEALENLTQEHGRKVET